MSASSIPSSSEGVVSSAPVVEEVAVSGGVSGDTDRVVELLSLPQCSRDELLELEHLLVKKKKTELVEYGRSFSVKFRRSDVKAVILGRILSYRKLDLTKSVDVVADGRDTEDGRSTVPHVLLTAQERDQLAALPPFQSVKEGWTKRCDALSKSRLSFDSINTYLIESRDDTFNEERREAYKSLKGYKYYRDELVRNVWCKEFHRDLDVLYFKGHVHASWTVGQSYDVFVRIFANGTVGDGACSCVAGQGGTCSHVSALLFFCRQLQRSVKKSFLKTLLRQDGRASGPERRSATRPQHR